MIPIALFALLAGPQQGGQVTLTTELVSAQVAIAKLAEASQTPLRVSPMLAEYPLLLKLKDHDRDDALLRIANVLGGEWKRDGDGYQLLPDPAALREPDARRIAAIDASLATLEAKNRDVKFDEKFAEDQRKKSSAMMEKFTEIFTTGQGEVNFGEAIGMGGLDISPASVALTTVLRKIGAKNLAALRPGDRAVYSLNPTQMQYALPAGTQEAFRNFLIQSAAMQSASKTTEAPGGFDMMSLLNGGDGPIVVANLQTALVTITPQKEMLMVTLGTYDGTGKSIRSGFAYFPITFSAPAANAGAESLPINYDAIGQEMAAKWTAVTQGLSGLMGGSGISSMKFSLAGMQSGMIAARKPISAELRRRLTDPVVNEVAAPLFNPVAAAFSGDIIATVPDDGVGKLAEIATTKAMTGAKALAALEVSPNYLVVRDGNTVTIGASSISELRRSHTDRAALRKLAQRVSAQGFARLDDRATFAVVQKEVGGAASLANPLLSILGSASTIMTITDDLVQSFQALRVWGSLTPEQRQRFGNGRGVAFNDLSADARDAVARALFFSDVPIGEVADGGMPNFMGMIFGGGTYQQEKTVRFGHGLPNEGFVGATVTTEECYLMRDSATNQISFGGSDILGFSRAAKKVPFLSAIAGNDNYDAFTPANSTHIDLKFVISKDEAIRHTLTDYATTSERVFRYDEMPDEFRKSVEQITKSMEDFNIPIPKPKIKP